mgnify:CR=1 FL=1|tara:strand:+ start:113 stop:544 length:432 start_codon:yes stop_codon:yes gene_type:complete
MKDMLLNNNQAKLNLSSNCQVQNDNELYYKKEFMDSYKIAIELEVGEEDSGEEVYNLIDDIKNLLKERKGSSLYKSIKSIGITRSQNMMVVNQWKEGIESGNKEGMVYQIPLNSHEEGHTEPFVVKEVGNTREEEVRKSSWGN